MVSEHSLRMFLPYFIVIAVRYAFGCRTTAITRLATFGGPHRPILSRVRCIAWFGTIVMSRTDTTPKNKQH